MLRTKGVKFEQSEVIFKLQKQISQHSDQESQSFEFSLASEYKLLYIIACVYQTQPNNHKGNDKVYYFSKFK